MTFTDSDMREYDAGRNRRQYYVFYGVAVVLAVLVGGTWLFDVDLGVVSSAASHVSTTVQSASLLGVFYLTAIGGFFVFTFPLEALYISGLTKNDPLAVFVVALLGVALSYTVNYYTGRYLSTVVRPVIGTKSFYAWKSRLGRYGSWIIVVVNVLPMVSQAFTAVLGVFRYDARRTALYTMTGQVLKFGGLAVITQVI